MLFNYYLRVKFINRLRLIFVQNPFIHPLHDPFFISNDACAKQSMMRWSYEEMALARHKSKYTMMEHRAVVFVSSLSYHRVFALSLHRVIAPSHRHRIYAPSYYRPKPRWSIATILSSIVLSWFHRYGLFVLNIYKHCMA